MGSEYFINSQELENKVRDLLPSQGGAGAGFDLSASTQIIPIIDLTESAEGSNVREDLQTAFSFTTISQFSVSNATTTLITNTGYFRIFGAYSALYAGGVINGDITISDGTGDKKIIEFKSFAGTDGALIESFDFIVFLEAGDSIKATTSSTNAQLTGNTRQIADITGSLVNP